MGLFPGKEKMPVEEKLFNKIVEEFNFEKKYALKCIEDNRHNHITACYHLIDRRNKKLNDIQDVYQQSKIDFKKKMRMGTNIKNSFASYNENSGDGVRTKSKKFTLTEFDSKLKIRFKYDSSITFRISEKWKKNCS
jgi:hypothetical protein